jgi:hypothetical protein
MARDWSRESWHKTYSREAGGWAALSFEARGLYRLLQDDASRDGIVDTGDDSIEWAVAVYRIERQRAEMAFRELVSSKLVVREDGHLSLPVHAKQQATITSSSERVRRHRDKARNGETVTALHETLPVTHDVSLKRKERNKENKDYKEQNARAREAAAAAPVDPKVRRIALELAAHKKFASLDHPVVAEELLGSLGSLALGLVEERITEAVAVAAAEAESGANERRLRQVLGWKLKDAASGKTSKKPAYAVGKDGVPMVQGVGPEHEGEIERLLARIDKHNAEDAVKREEYRRANGLTEEVPF